MASKDDPLGTQKVITFQYKPPPWFTPEDIRAFRVAVNDVAENYLLRKSPPNLTLIVNEDV